MIRRPPRSTPLYSSAASDVYKRQPSDSLTLRQDAQPQRLQRPRPQQRGDRANAGVTELRCVSSRRGRGEARSPHVGDIHLGRNGLADGRQCLRRDTDCGHIEDRGHPKRSASCRSSRPRTWACASMSPGIKAGLQCRGCRHISASVRRSRAFISATRSSNFV